MTRSGLQRFLALPSAFRTATWFAILTVPAAVAAYYRIFSGFAGWDDEGAFMMTVKQYLTGAKLYEEIYSGYGPVYYSYNWLVRSATGTALDHNAVRITSAVVSLLCSLFCAWVVLRLTKSLPAASVTHLLVFRVLSFFNNEPGHPQELCMLLLVCLAGSGILAANPRRVWLAMAAAGSIAAALTLIKINIGIFAILAVALPVLFQAPQGWFSRLAQYAAGAAALLIPFALMRAHLNDPATQAYCFVVTASMAALLAGPLGFTRPGSLSSRECWAAAAAFAATLTAVLLVLVAQGIPLSRVFTMLVLKHVRLNVSEGTWYRAVELGRIWMAWALIGLGAAVFFARVIRDGKKTVQTLVAPFQLVFGAAALLFALIAPGLLLGFVTPFCWLLLCSPENTRRRDAHARMLLATAAVLQTLYAFPFAGSQTFFLRVLLVIVAAVSFSDGLQGLPETGGLAAILLRYSRPAAVVTLAAVALAYPVLAYRARLLYASLTPLDMPGAERIHVEEDEAEDYQWLVTRLRRNCDTFVGLPGIPSLYFWTGKPLPGPAHQPPGPLNMASWMLTYSPGEQLAVVDDLSRYPSACAVYSPGGLKSWHIAKVDLNNWPLANYILTHFKTIGQTGDYQFMVRNERQLTIPDGVRGAPRRQPR
jgi:hypothetical protein